MKKAIGLLTLLCLLSGLLAGCGTPSGTPAGGSDSAQTEPDVPTGTSPDADLPNGPSKPAGDGSVDVDLTALSSTMVYAEVYNMMTDPDAYMGKTIKMSGQYYSSYFEETEQYYFFVVISDATACCQQGIEFIWNGEHTYPEDYPEDGTEVEVTGVFGSYQELDQTYYCLTVDDITRL